MKRFKPSGAMVIAVCALTVALTGGATAAALINGHDIKPGTVGHAQLSAHSVLNSDIGKGAVRADNLSSGLLSQLNRKAPSPSAGSSGSDGPQGPQGQKGDKGDPGAPGSDGHDGQNGANPGVAVLRVPSIAGSSGKNPNPDSGDPGDAGWYFSGDGSGGSATLAGGELILTGSGVDGNTFQGGIGIAKAFNNVPLSQLSGVSYDYHVQTTDGANTPLVHVTVTGLKADSKFASGFANLVYSPALNNGNTTPVTGQTYSADAFLPGAKWYSTAQPNIGDPGGQNDPQPLSFFQSGNPSAVIGQISLDNGGSSGSSGTFSAGADDLVLGFDGAITRYDFGG